MSRATKRPSRLFRIHRRNGGRDAFVGRKPLPDLLAWVAANRARFRPGRVAELIVEHDATCRYPQGGPCVCRTGPDVRVEDRP
jgi:hypothetical protein